MAAAGRATQRAVEPLSIYAHNVDGLRLGAERWVVVADHVRNGEFGFTDGQVLVKRVAVRIVLALLLVPTIKEE